ncbi:hypothetical protein QBC45DRAFT_297057, partial [Copromyces sp. CBS 386.78]
SEPLIAKSFLGFFYHPECPPFGFASVFPPSPTLDPFPESRAPCPSKSIPFPPSNSRGSTNPKPLALPSCCSPLQ